LVEFLNTFDLDLEINHNDFIRYYDLASIAYDKNDLLVDVISSCWFGNIPKQSQNQMDVDHSYSVQSSRRTSPSPDRSTVRSQTGSYTSEMMEEYDSRKREASPMTRQGVHFDMQSKVVPDYEDHNGLVQPPWGRDTDVPKYSRGYDTNPMHEEQKPTSRAHYDPSDSFSFSSPTSIGVFGNAKVSKRALGTSNPMSAVPLIRSNFPSTRPLPLLRKALNEVSNSDEELKMNMVFKNDMIKVLSEFCPKPFVERLWEEFLASGKIDAKTQMISVDELLRSLRSYEPTDRRIQIVNQAFNRLDPNQEGSVSREVLKQMHRPV
jgi:hypothetical protein